MLWIAMVNTANGDPCPDCVAEIVEFSKGQVMVRGTGSVTKGELSVQTDVVGPGWGLRLGGLPAHAAILGIQGDTVNFGTIVFSAEPVLSWVSFHAPSGMVVGVPRPVNGTGREKQPINTVTAPKTLESLVGSAARQIRTAALPKENAEEEKSGLVMTGASVKLRGFPEHDGTNVTMRFPTGETLGTTAAGTLSEVMFDLASNGALPATPEAKKAPDLVRYTKTLALRKLAAAGLRADVNDEIVSDTVSEGRVVRQMPLAGKDVPAGVVRLFIGKKK